MKIPVRLISCVPRLHVWCLVALAWLLVGCASKLIIDTKPTGAFVTVTDAKGKVMRTGPAPLEAELTFSEKKDLRYSVAVQPTNLQAERYFPKSHEMTLSSFSGLPDGPGKVKQLVVELEERPYVSIPVVDVMLTPTGKWVGVVNKTRTFKDIAEAGGIVPTMIVDFGANTGIQGLALSPEGERLVYSEAVFNQPLNNLDEILALGSDRVLPLKGANLRGINIQGGGIQHITTEDFRDMFPAFTPDGEKLYFSSNRRRNKMLDILGIKANGRSGIADIYAYHRDGMVLKPSAAKDGTVAFCVVNINPETGHADEGQIWTHYGPSDFPTQITRGRQPAISPDGGYIAYIAPDGNVWITDVDGTNQTQLTTGASTVIETYRKNLGNLEQQLYDANIARDLPPITPFSDPSWSPDGQHIVYTSMEGLDPTGRPNQDIWIMNRDGTQRAQLTTNGSADRFPLMTPDGRNIYFLSNRGETWAIWRIPVGELD